jgi:hypothetical protein
MDRIRSLAVRLAPLAASLAFVAADFSRAASWGWW